MAPGKRACQLPKPFRASGPEVWPAPRMLRVPTVIGAIVSPPVQLVRGGGVLDVAAGDVGQVAAEDVGDVAGDVLPLGVGVGEPGALHGLGGLGQRHLLPAGDVEQPGVAGVLGSAEEGLGRQGGVGDLGAAAPASRGTLLEQAAGVAVTAVEVDQLGLLDRRGDRDLEAVAGDAQVARDLGDGDRVAGLLGRQGGVGVGEAQLHQCGEDVAGRRGGGRGVDVAGSWPASSMPVELSA